MEKWYYFTFQAYYFKSCIFIYLRYANDMLIRYYANKKSSPGKVAVVATKLNFLQHTYRVRINHITLYSETFPGPHFGS